LLLRFYKREDVRVLEFISERIPVFKKELNGIKNFLEKFVE
jgi:hypothetical protein